MCLHKLGMQNFAYSCDAGRQIHLSRMLLITSVAVVVAAVGHVGHGLLVAFKNKNTDGWDIFSQVLQRDVLTRFSFFFSGSSGDWSSALDMISHILCCYTHAPSETSIL